MRASGTGEALVEVRGAVKHYPGVVALAGVDFEIRRGEIIGLVGKNGAGKSSLIKIIAGAEKPDEGELVIGGRPPPHGYAPHVAHRLGLAFVHQELGNFPALSVAENVALGTRYPRRLGVLVSRKALNRRVKAVLDELPFMRPYVIDKTNAGKSGAVIPVYGPDYQAFFTAKWGKEFGVK